MMRLIFIILIRPILKHCEMAFIIWGLVFGGEAGQELTGEVLEVNFWIFKWN